MDINGYCNPHENDDFITNETMEEVEALVQGTDNYDSEVVNEIARSNGKINLYKAYNDYITRKLDEYGITVEHRKRKFDHFVWYKNRNRLLTSYNKSHIICLCNA